MSQCAVQSWEFWKLPCSVWKSMIKCCMHPCSGSGPEESRGRVRHMYRSLWYNPGQGVLERVTPSNSNMCTCIVTPKVLLHFYDSTRWHEVTSPLLNLSCVFSCLFKVSLLRLIDFLICKIACVWQLAIMRSLKNPAAIIRIKTPQLGQVRFPTVIVDECTQAAETAALVSWQQWWAWLALKSLANWTQFRTVCSHTCHVNIMP